MNVAFATARDRWLTAWPDALAFVAGLVVAGIAGWDIRDLVWSLWLSSFVVGYAMIVWTIFSCAWGRVGEMLGGVFMLAFFTFHFGLFHVVHAGFLGSFFPLTDGVRLTGISEYLEVLRRYWIWLPVAFFAERAAFRKPPPRVSPTSVKAADIDARRARGTGMFIPYLNVVRMHLLIFFFAFAHFMKWESFAVYAVVYAAYFFPWRLLVGKEKL